MLFIDESKIPDHPYPELRVVLHIFTSEISAVLGQNLVGIYLVGSLASGDFDLDSDVDFLVVTRMELAEADMKPLQDIQKRIHTMDCYPAKHLEGSYISLVDLNDGNTVGQKSLYYFDNGSTVYEKNTHDNRWHVRWILHQRGITLLGPKPETIMPAVPEDKLLDEIKGGMVESMVIFRDEINKPLSFCTSRFGQSFLVLTFCRMLHTLHTGKIQSKKEGMLWAKDCIDPVWAGLIAQAWNERQGIRFGVKIGQRADQALIDNTMEFLEYAVALSGKI